MNVDMTPFITNAGRPTVNARTYETKPALITMVSNHKFAGLPSQNPFTHLNTFLDLCSTVKINNVSDDYLRIKLFNFSLMDKAKVWYDSLPQEVKNDWAQLATAFL